MNNSFNTHNNHPFVPKEQTYVIERKLLAVHSEDRDYTQFPNSNSFTINIGEAMTNVQSVRLVSYSFPNNCYNISTSYQNTKLVFQYARDFIFDTVNVQDGNPSKSPSDPAPVNPGAADFKLGVFQNILDQLFPGIIRSYCTDPINQSVNPEGNSPTIDYFGPQGSYIDDWNDGKRAMVYSTSNNDYTDALEYNFGELGLPNDTSVFYETNNQEWVEIPLPFLSANPGDPWPNNIQPWDSVGPVDESKWSGKFKIRFETPELTITIPDGAYSPGNLAAAIQNKMNEQIISIVNTPGHQYIGLILGNTFNSNYINYSDVNMLGRTYDPQQQYITPYTKNNSPWFTPENTIKKFMPIVVTYNTLTNNMLIGSTEGDFTLYAGKEIKYQFKNCSPNKFMFSQYTKWGLPSYMGFTKATYHSFDLDIDNIPLQVSTTPELEDITGNNLKNIFIKNLNGLILYNNNSTNWISPTGEGIITFYDPQTTPVNPEFIPLNKIVSILNSPNNVNLMGEDCIYMEMEKFNNINEIYPFSERTNTMYNCDYGHKSDSSFAIIPLTQTPFGTELGNRTSMNTNAFMSEPPIKNISKLEFKFRYHDGRLVDFKALPFSFVLEFNMLRDEQARNKIIRIPHLY